MKLQPGLALSLLVAMLISCAFLIPNPAATPTITPIVTSRPIATPPEERPQDFSILYEWGEGIIAPPYYYQYSIKIDPTGQGEIQFIPNYPGEDDQVPVWNETFTVSQQELDGLYQLMRSKGLWSQDWEDLGEPPPGAGSETMVITADGGKFESPATMNNEQNSMMNEIYSAINALVPKDIWEKLMAQREKYIEEYPYP